MNGLNGHFLKEYVYAINEGLHRAFSTKYYKIEIYEVPDLLTSIFITYDDQEDDEFILFKESTLDDFNTRLNQIEPALSFYEETMKSLAEKPEKTIGGWMNRTIYMIKGGNNPEYWTPHHAIRDLISLIETASEYQGKLVHYELRNIHKIVPQGPEYFKDYEYLVRVSINYLFTPNLSEAIAQQRTEPGNEGLEIRDLICANNSDSGFWRDLKDKYLNTEVVFEVKNTDSITRDDLRQIYCYLKRAIGLWGFLICRGVRPHRTISLYNKTLFKNFEQRRGVLIITNRDLLRMVEMKLRNHDPEDYLRNKMSEFLRSI